MRRFSGGNPAGRSIPQSPTATRRSRPPSTFTVSYRSGGTSYTPRVAQPLGLQGTFRFEAVQSPENSLHVQSGLLALLARAGPGDTLLVEQFNEQLHWGPSAGTPDEDPNLRLAAYIAASRRGARVRILLDRYYADPLDPQGNFATEAYVNALAQTEGLDLAVRLGNPTGLGIHNKMVLAQIGGAGYVHAGSINGSESAAKTNRKLALQVESDEAYAYLAAVFEWDWQAARPPEPVYLPFIAGNHRAPAAHQLTTQPSTDP